MSSSRGELHVFLGIAPGAGKTYAMLAAGRRLADAGVNVVVALAETHGRADTTAMLEALPAVPFRKVDHARTTFTELDVDAVIASQPTVALVDELAHTCVPGSRHDKRWEDVEELLDAGIDVMTTLNVQHLDSLNDAVAAVTGFHQAETVPDAVVASAEKVEFVDISPDQLRARVAESDVLATGATAAALGGFFDTHRLAALRELALGWLDERDLLDAASRPLPIADRTWMPTERVVVALTGEPEGEHILRRAAHLARSVHGELIGVHVCEPSGLASTEPVWLTSQRQLLSELGGSYTELGAIDVSSAVLDFARMENARQIVLGATRRARWQELMHGSIINKAIRSAGPIEVHVIPARRRPRRPQSAQLRMLPSARRVELPGPRRFAAWVTAVLAPAAIAGGLLPIRSSLGLAGALLCAILPVLGVALLGGIRPAMLATLVGFGLTDFVYTRPFYSFRVDRLIDLMGLIVFVVVAAVVGMLVEQLTRRSVHVARTRAEAENLARLTAEYIAAPRHFDGLVADVRRVFDLDGVAVLCRDASQWRVEATAGRTPLRRPEDASVSIEIAPNRVLVMVGSRLDDQNATLLQVFVDHLRIAREGALLRVLSPEPDSASRDGEGPPSGHSAGPAATA